MALSLLVLLLLLLLLLLHLLLLLLLLLSCHHSWMAHLVHHSLSLLRWHPLAYPLLLRVLMWNTHPLLWKLYLRGQLALGQVTLLRGLLHGPTSANHHPWRGTLLLIHVGPGSCHCCLGLWWHNLGSNHPYCSWVSHAHLLTLTLLMVRVRRHQACSCLGCLSLQSHLPLSIGYLLDLHGNFYCCRWRARRGLLLLLWKGRLALGLAGRLLAPDISSHDSAHKLLGRCCGAKDRFALGLMDWGGARGSAGIWRQIVGVLLELLRVGPCSTLLLLDLRKHLLLMLRRVHYPPRTASSTWHLLELVVNRVLRRHAALWGHSTWLLLLLLNSRSRAHSLLRDWRHGLSWGLGCWGLGST